MSSDTVLFENDLFRVEREPFEIPWIKIFTHTPYKELSDCPREIRIELFDMIDIIENEMRRVFSPTKINIASFGNYLPRVHIHIQARFEKDSYFPEPTWGQKQRESTLDLDKDTFYKQIKLLLGKRNG